MNPEQKALSQIIKRCKNSKYLSNFGIKNFSLEEFRDKVPVVTYSDIEPFITRAYNGEQNIFSEDKISLWVFRSLSLRHLHYFRDANHQ
jgi:hypothetical protein